MKDFVPAETPTQHVLDDPPPFHQRLLQYGERPYWSSDGKKIAFIDKNYGDVAEIDLETRRVRNLTKNLGDHHAFLRVLFLHDDSYLLIGPKEFKDRDVSRHVESEIWWMDREAKRPPVPLGRRMFEGAGVSTRAPRITYAVSGRNDPSLGGKDTYVCYVTELDLGSDPPRIVRETEIYRQEGTARRPEPQDFRHDDGEVILAEYVGHRLDLHPDYKCMVKGVDVESKRVRTYIDEPNVHNECEGIFPDGEHICLESSVDSPSKIYQNTDLFKLKLDGSGRRARLTDFRDRWPWRASNSNVRPDGRWLAFMVNLHGDEAGYGRGMGLLDLAAWEESTRAQEWDQAPTGDNA